MKSYIAMAKVKDTTKNLTEQKITTSWKYKSWDIKRIKSYRKKVGNFHSIFLK